MESKRIKAKVCLGLPLTSHERAIYLLFISTKEEMLAFLRAEKEGKQ